MKKVLNVLKFTLSIVLGLWLFWFVFRGMDINTIYEELKKAHFSWVFLSIFISIFGFYFRAIRWKLLFQPLGYNIKTHNALIAVFIGFFANLLFPRLGEVTRCAYLTKVHEVKLSECFGTVITERIIDLLCFLVLAVITFFIEWDVFQNVFLQITDSVSMSGLLSKGSFLAGLLLFIVLLAYLFFKLGLIEKLKSFALGLIKGVLSIVKLQNARSFVLSTIGIWIVYYAMLYVLFFSLDATSHLPPIVALSMLIAGTVGMIVPVQSGIGAYHFFVSLVLGYYGVTGDANKLLPLISHGSQTLLVFFVGLICLGLSTYFVTASNKGKDD